MSSSIKETSRRSTDTPPRESRRLASISVIVPVRNEELHMAKTLDQLLELDRQNLEVEIMVVDGRSTDRTREIVKEYVRRHPEIRLCDNPRRLSSVARNVGIEESAGDYVVVIDGHCEITSRDYLHHVVDAFERSGADCLGRPQPLFAADPTPLQRAIAVGRTSWLGHHPASYVYSQQERDVPAISVAVAYRRSVFERVGVFDDRFDACEDCELNHRIDKAGLRCRFVPQLAVVYKPRTSLRGLFQQLARYGRGRVRLARKHPETLSIFSCAPPAFAIAALLGAVVCAVVPLLWPFYLAVLAVSVLTVLGTSVYLAWQKVSVRMLAQLPVVFAIIHSSYTWGFLSELLSVCHPMDAWRRKIRAPQQASKNQPAPSSVEKIVDQSKVKGH